MADKDTEPTKEQEKTAENTMRGADGTYNPAKVNLNKMFADKANEKSYTDEQGNKKSYNKGTKWQAKMDELPEDARNYVYQRLNEYKSKGRPLNKWDLREIEHSAKAKFGLPKSFDISSGAMFDNTMAKMLNSINVPKGEQPAAKTETKPTETSPAAEQKTEQKPAGKQVGNSNKDVANAQVGDYIIRKDGSTYVLKQADIDWAKKKFAPQLTATQTPAQPATQTSATPAQTTTKPTDDDDAFMKQYTTYAGQRTPEARKFMSDPANVKRYQEILKKRNSVKNNSEIEKLKQELELHKKTMAENPGRKDIQVAQQGWIDSITKKIEKLGGSVE